MKFAKASFRAKNIRFSDLIPPLPFGIGGQVSPGGLNLQNLLFVIELLVRQHRFAEQFNNWLATHVAQAPCLSGNASIFQVKRCRASRPPNSW